MSNIKALVEALEIMDYNTCDAAAKELRRLEAKVESMRQNMENIYAENRKLLEALRDVDDQMRHPDYDWPVWLSQKVSAAIQKHGGKA